MLKLRKPFSRKVKLHIRQDLLQKLWDKYVPEASEKYGNIELIYTDPKDGQTEAQPRQVQLLVNLLLQNRILKAGLSDLRTVPAAGGRQMENSVRRAEKCFLAQLRCYDVRLFRTVSRYVTLLEQAEKDGRRYQGWQRESQSIEKQWTQYRLFSAFSSDAENFLTEHSVETAREMEKELIRVLPESEYSLLAERILDLAEPKEFMLQYIDVMEADEIRQLWEQLEEFGRKPQEQANVSGFQKKMMELHVRYGQEVARGFRERVSSILNEESYQTVSKPYREIMDMVMASESNQEAADMAMALELNQEAADMAMASEPNQEAADMTMASEPYQEPADRVSEIYQTMERVRLKLKEQKERILQREVRAFETYRQLYGEVLAGQDLAGRQEAADQSAEGTFGEVRQENVRRFVEAMFQSRHQGEMSEGELRNICEWGRVFAELFAKPISENQDRNRESQDADSGEAIEDKAGYVNGYHEEMVYLTKKISRYIEEQSMEPFLQTWKEHVLKGSLMKEQGLGNLLEKIHVLDGERRIELVRNLSDMVRIWIQVAPSVQSGKPETGEESVRQTVQDIFRRERQVEMSGEELHELCEWGRVITGTLTKLRSAEQEPAEAVDGARAAYDERFGDEAWYQEEMVYLINEIGHKMEGRTAEPLLQTWKEHVLKGGLMKEQGLGDLLEKIRVLDGERRIELVRNLSDMVRIWIQAIPAVQSGKPETGEEGFNSKEGQLESIRQTVQDVFRKEHQAEMSGEELRELSEWGRVLTRTLTELRSTEVVDGEESVYDERFGDEAWYQEEMVDLVSEISREMEGQTAEPFLQAWKGHVLKGGFMKEQGLRNLLEKIHVLDEEKRAEFVGRLSDILSIWIQVSTSMQLSSDVKSREVSVWQTVEAAFQSRHQREMSGEDLRELCEWGRVLAETASESWTDTESGVDRPEADEQEEEAGYHAEMVYLVGEINRYIEDEEPGTFSKAWQEQVVESGLKDQNIRNLLENIHVLDEERRTEFVRRLSESIHIWNQVSLPDPAAKDWPSPGRTRLADVSFQKLWEWGEALRNISDHGEAPVAFSEEGSGNEERMTFSEAISSESGSRSKEPMTSSEAIPSESGSRSKEPMIFSEAISSESGSENEERMTSSEVIPSESGSRSKERMTSSKAIPSESGSKSKERMTFSEAISSGEGSEREREESILRELIWQINHKMEEVQEAAGDVTGEQTEEELRAETEEGFAEAPVSQDISDKAMESGPEDSFRLLYADSQLESRPIQSLLRYVRELDEEQYAIFIRELFQITQIQWKLSLGQGMEEEAEQELRQILIQRNRRLLKPGHELKMSGTDEAETVDVPYLRMWEWGQALLFYPEYAQDEKAEPAQSSEDKAQTAAASKAPRVQDSALSMDDGAHATGPLPEERGRKQTEWIRRQIEEGKDRNNLQQLIGQINHRLVFTQKKEEGETKTDETLQLIYADSQLSVPSVQSLLRYIRNLDEEGYGELVKELAQVTKVQSMLSSGTGDEEETAREIRQMLTQRKTDIRSSLLAAAFNKVWEWGKALLYYPEQGQKMPERMLPPAKDRRQEGQDVLLHIESIAERNNLRQIIRQINHLAAPPQPEYQRKTQKPEAEPDMEKDQKPGEKLEAKPGSKEGRKRDQEAEPDRKKGGSRQIERTFRLAYAPGKLQIPAVQNLLHYIQRLDEEQYEVLIEELTKVTSIQQMMMAMERIEAEKIPEPAEISHRIVPGMENQPDLPGIGSRPDMENLSGMPGVENHPDMPGTEIRPGIRSTEIKPGMRSTENQTETAPAQGKTDSQDQRRKGGYPELAHRIMQYETQRRRIVGQNLRQIEKNYPYPVQSGGILRDIGGMAPIFFADGSMSALMEFTGRIRSQREEPEEAGILAATEFPEGEYAKEYFGSGYPAQELAYSMPDTDTSREEQHREKLRMQEENIQIKSAQEQLGRKLTEVEKQLKAVEGAAKAKEDVRTFADQVKRQLYEELHVEKLRRGLI